MKAFEHYTLVYRLDYCDKQHIQLQDWVSIVVDEYHYYGFKTINQIGIIKFFSVYTLSSGVYTYLFEKFSNPDGSPPGFFKKAGLGMSAGACGAFVGTPAEISLIRMTADGNLPAAERR